jgi:hypothetical protein
MLRRRLLGWPVATDLWDVTDETDITAEANEEEDGNHPRLGIIDVNIMVSYSLVYSLLY